MSDYVIAATLREQQRAGEAPMVVDVRSVEEYRAGHLPGARHIPADALPNRLAAVPRDRPVVTY